MENFDALQYGQKVRVVKSNKDLESCFGDQVGMVGTIKGLRREDAMVLGYFMWQGREYAISYHVSEIEVVQ